MCKGGACQQCGMCCTSPAAGSLKGELTSQDAKRMTTFQRTMITGSPSGRVAMRTRRGERATAICMALSGKPGQETCSCLLYPNRPWMCRAFEPGSEMCKHLQSVGKRLRKEDKGEVEF